MTIIELLGAADQAQGSAYTDGRMFFTANIEPIWRHRGSGKVLAGGATISVRTRNDQTARPAAVADIAKDGTILTIQPHWDAKVSDWTAVNRHYQEG